MMIAEQDFIDKYMAGLIKTRSSSSLSGNDLDDFDGDDGKMADDDENEDSALELAQFQAWLEGKQVEDPPCTPSRPRDAAVPTALPETHNARPPTSGGETMGASSSACSSSSEVQQLAASSGKTTWDEDLCGKCGKNPCYLHSLGNCFVSPYI